MFRSAERLIESPGFIILLVLPFSVFTSECVYACTYIHKQTYWFWTELFKSMENHKAEVRGSWWWGKAYPEGSMWAKTRREDAGQSSLEKSVHRRKAAGQKWPLIPGQDVGWREKSLCITRLNTVKIFPAPYWSKVMGFSAPLAVGIALWLALASEMWSRNEQVTSGLFLCLDKWECSPVEATLVILGPWSKDSLE